MLVCYHHTDLDGMSAAYCVHTYKPSQIEDSANNYFACNYESKFDKHTAADEVFIVDISISEKTYPMFIEAVKNARTVTWIDHHATSEEVISNHYDELQGMKNLTYFVNGGGCGALLAYCYLHIPASEFLRIRQIDEGENYGFLFTHGTKQDPNAKGIVRLSAIKKAKGNKGQTICVDGINHEIIIPEWLKLVDDYDRWQKQYPETENFFFGTSAEDISFTCKDKNSDQIIFAPFWNYEKIKDIKTLITAGESISKYIHATYTRELSDTFEYVIDGTTFLCKNGRGNSYNFEDMIEKYAAVILFHYSAKIGKWKYSVYSHDKSLFDCSEFCKKYGGGGHFHASGFSTDKLIFTIGLEAKNKDDIIFLGGTCNGSEWRSKFIDTWKKYIENHKDLKDRKIELFNPIVEDWTPECQEKEDKVKSNACLNMFIITPEQKGAYSFAEAVECANSGSKVFFAIYDEHKQFDTDIIKSMDAIGVIIEKHGGIYEKYFEEDMDAIVRDVIASL